VGIQRRNRGNFCLAHDCVKSVGMLPKRAKETIV
jgi:hypothetical protein